MLLRLRIAIRRAAADGVALRTLVGFIHGSGGFIHRLGGFIHRSDGFIHRPGLDFQFGRIGLDESLQASCEFSELSLHPNRVVGLELRIAAFASLLSLSPLLLSLKFTFASPLSLSPLLLPLAAQTRNATGDRPHSFG